MADRFFAQTTETNPRGIPRAPFLEKIEEWVKGDAEFEPMMNRFQERLQQYKYMEASKVNTRAGLVGKIPEMEKTLAGVRLVQSGKEVLVDYELNDTLYTKAVVAPAQVVYLWLGADVMMEYPVDEAAELLEGKLTGAQAQLADVDADIEFLRENITTMEVNTARLYNWDVLRRTQK